MGRDPRGQTLGLGTQQRLPLLGRLGAALPGVGAQHTPVLTRLWAWILEGDERHGCACHQRVVGSIASRRVPAGQRHRVASFL